MTSRCAGVERCFATPDAPDVEDERGVIRLVRDSECHVETVSRDRLQGLGSPLSKFMRLSMRLVTKKNATRQVEPVLETTTLVLRQLERRDPYDGRVFELHCYFS